MMSSARLSIAIAGCGPAGLSAALLLARDGHHVTLFERFERPAPLGSGLILQPTGLAVLAALGLAPSMLALGQRIDRMLGRACPSNRVVLDVRYGALRGQRFGLAVHRASLFAVLFDAVRAAGLEIETGCEIIGSDVAADGRRALILTSRRRIGPFDLVVDSLGASSRLAGTSGRLLPYGALWASLDWPAGTTFDAHALEQRYRRANVMIGVLPLGRVPGLDARQTAFFWSLRADDFEAWRQRGLTAWKDEVLAIWPQTAPLLDQIADRDRLVMARYTHKTLHSPVASGLAHIGDAAHATSPQLGQGANMALLDSFALALALREAPSIADALASYSRRRRRHVRLYQAMSWMFTPFYQSDSRLLPAVRDRLVGPLARTWPAPTVLAALVAGLFGRPLHAIGLDEFRP